MEEKKYCKYCGEIIDKECMVCPKCGKQIEQLQNVSQPNIVINNAASANATADNHVNGMGIPGMISPKSRLIALLLSIFLGWLGIHRFYAGKIGTGILWMFSFGMLGIGWLYDVIVILLGCFKDNYGRVIKNW